MSKKNFGKLGDITVQSNKNSNDESSSSSSANISSKNDLLKKKQFVKVTSGAAIGTAVVLTALHPFDVRAGATGVP